MAYFIQYINCLLPNPKKRGTYLTTKEMNIYSTSLPLELERMLTGEKANFSLWVYSSSYKVKPICLFSAGNAPYP